MKRNEVMQAYYIHREILMWENKLKQLKQTSEAKSAPTYIQSGKSKNRISDSIGETATRLAEIEAIIDGLLSEVKIAEKNIIIYINSLSDSLERQIVFYRCIEYMPWQKVAHKIGGGNTADGVRMRFDRMFPKKNQEK